MDIDISNYNMKTETDLIFDDIVYATEYIVRIIKNIIAIVSGDDIVTRTIIRDLLYFFYTALFIGVKILLQINMRYSNLKIVICASIIICVITIVDFIVYGVKQEIKNIEQRVISNKTENIKNIHLRYWIDDICYIGEMILYGIIIAIGLAYFIISFMALIIFIGITICKIQRITYNIPEVFYHISIAFNVVNLALLIVIPFVLWKISLEERLEKMNKTK